MNNIAILAGCQYYLDDTLNNLIGVNYDVSLMRRALIDYCGCCEDNVFELTNYVENNYRPSGGDILNQIRLLKGNYEGKEIGNLFFYYSGHGFIYDNELHLIPSDAIPSMLHATISISKLKGTLDASITAKHIIIILDICQEEYVAKGNNYENIDCFPINGTIIFYSCSPNQSSYMLASKDGIGSLYTRFFVDALSSPQRSCTIREISTMVQNNLREYCSAHNISQNPHTEIFDVSMADVVIANNRNTPYSVPPQAKALDMSRSIWLIDAEKAVGEQSRFETFTNTPTVSKFVEKGSEFWGVASVKGIGKTFLLQVKRLKMSHTAHCFPNIKACRDNNWATECIKFTNSEKSIQLIKNYSDVRLLWKYSLVCYILHCWLSKQLKSHGARRNKKYNDISHWIIDKYHEGSMSRWTYQFLTDQSYYKLQQIIEAVMRIANWADKIVPEYGILQNLGQLIIVAIEDTSKKSLVLFLDKVDQAMRQPNSEHALDCECCSKRESITNCNNGKKGSTYCSSDDKDACTQRALCCYGCDIYADPSGGSNLRINEDGNLRDRHCNYWQRLQLALVEAVIDIKNDFDGHIKVMYTVRLEACNYKETVWGDQRAKVMALTCILNYTRDEQKRIYQECIEHQEKSLLYLPRLSGKNGREDEAFVGVRKICHPYVPGASESIFDIVYRHSFGRTRDIQDYGQALTEKMQDIKAIVTEDERGSIVKQIIEETAARLAYNTNRATRSSENSYYFEKMPNLPSYWADPENFEQLMNNIDRNLLFYEDMQRICQKINQVCKCPYEGCKLCQHHPFSMLKNVGMLGYIVLSENKLRYSTQHFLGAQDVTYFHDEDDLKINANTLYLIHPAFTKSIEKLKNERKIMHFCGFLIGKDIQVQQSVLREIFSDRQKLSPYEFEKKYYKFVDSSPLLSQTFASEAE